MARLFLTSLSIVLRCTPEMLWLRFSDYLSIISSCVDSLLNRERAHSQRIDKSRADYRPFVTLIFQIELENELVVHHFKSHNLKRHLIVFGIKRTLV